jgi:hypothetical protein
MAIILRVSHCIPGGNQTLANMAMENPPFVDVFPIKVLIWGFPIVMFDYRRVINLYCFNVKLRFTREEDWP